MDDLQREAEELKCIERTVQEQFERAKQAGQEIDEQVNQWLKDAQNFSDIMKSNWLIDKKADSSWMKRFFSMNHQAKTAEEDVVNMINQVNALVARGKRISSVCFDADTIGIELVWRNDFVKFKSRKHVFQRIMDALKKEEDGIIIGVFGMGGIGKTKLAVEIGKKAKDKGLFSKVVMATVSQSPNIRKIQGMLADMAQLKLHQDNETGRSNVLQTELGKEKRILVILDDVWEKIDIERIGIPKRCKIILTTRREEVCQNMGCISPICLDRITYNEALSLFQSYASTNRRPDLKTTVKKIVWECGGLPLAVVTVGSALRDKGLEEFENAAWKLSNSRYVDIESADKEIYACLGLSYDYLDDIAQKCFLLCSLYPEDAKIEVEGLTRYAYGLCLFGNVESVDQARQQMIASVTKLENVCLLPLVKDDDMFLHNSLDVCTVNYFSIFKMHDMVRDVALWIAKLDGLFLVPSSLKQCQRKDMSEKTTAVYLNSQDSHDNFPQELECPNLEILILHGIRSTTLPGNFFRKACSLKVLDLEMETFSGWDTVDLPGIGMSLTVSFQHLVNLKVLRVFAGCLRNDASISIICNLKSLEILELSFPRDEKVLPEWIEDLCNLRVLNLTESYHLQEIPCNLLPKLPLLEELYTPRHHESKWSDTFLSDLKSLPRLSVLTGWFSRFIFSFPGRKVGRHMARHMYSGMPKILRLDEFNDESMKMLEPLWPGVSYLEIGMTCMKGIRNLCPHFDNSGFQNLRKLELYHSPSLECFIDTTTEKGQRMRSLTTAKVLPNLVDLSLFRMEQLRRICNGPPPHLKFLGNLRCLWIVDCPMIENLFPDMLSAASQLKILWIESCGALKSLYDPVQTRIHQLQNLSCESEKQKLINMGYDDAELQTMTLDAMLFSLTQVDISECSNLEEVFPVSEINNQHCSWKLTNLIYLYLSRLPKLKCIWKVPQQNYCLLNLERVSLSGCDKLSSVFTPTLAQSLVKLKSLVIRECAMLETIISPDKQDEPLKRPHSSTSRTSFQKLEFLEVKSCDKLKSVLPMAFAASLPKLQNIEIMNCEMLEEIFDASDENKADSQSQDVVLKNLQHLKLVDLPKLVPFSLFTWNQMLTSLLTLKMSGTTFKQASDIVLAEGQEETSNGILPIRAAGSLRRMEVDSESYFSSVEEAFDVEDAQQPILTGLHHLKLGYMPKLRYLWRGSAEFISLCNLKEIEVYNCPSIKSLFPHSFCWTLHSLETFKVYNCKELKNIIEPSDHEQHSLHGRCFPKLESLYVGNCEILESIFPVFVVQDIPCLRVVEVHDCPKLENININVLKRKVKTFI